MSEGQFENESINYNPIVVFHLISLSSECSKSVLFCHISLHLKSVQTLTSFQLLLTQLRQIVAVILKNVNKESSETFTAGNLYDPLEQGHVQMERQHFLFQTGRSSFF